MYLFIVLKYKESLPIQISNTHFQILFFNTGTGTFFGENPGTETEIPNTELLYFMKLNTVPNTRYRFGKTMLDAHP